MKPSKRLEGEGGDGFIGWSGQGPGEGGEPAMRITGGKVFEGTACAKALRWKHA